MSNRHLAACAIVVTSLLSPTFASMGRADEATGLALYDEADRLLKDGQLASACEKFALSQKQHPRSVTLLRLADCYDRLGKTASAWSTFREAKLAADAAKQRPDANVAKEDARIAEAERRIAQLDGRLTRVRVEVEERAPGLVVKRDGAEVADGLFGTATPVDPGRHAFEASAPGREPWRAEIDVAGEGKTVPVVVPKLKVAAAAATSAPAATTSTIAPATTLGPQPPPATQDASPRGGGQRTIGLVVAGAGVVGMGVGGVLGFLGKSKADGANCDASNVCATPADVQTRHDAVKLESTATIVFGVGAALAVTGVVVWLTAPTGDGAKAGVGVTTIGLSPAGIVVGGAF